MTSPTIDDGTQPRLWRSIGAVLAGLITIFALSLGVDQIFHELGVYPPWGKPMNEAGDNLLALSYRVFIAVFGSWLTARLAPSAPMRHALILGGIGVLLSALGGFAAVRMGMGPAWYPILLTLSSIPCAWLGGFLARRATS